jgi:mitochondrial fission protein ELM1
LQHPQTDLRQFDLIVAPEHDGLTGPNVITTCGALHPLSPAILRREARRGPVAGLASLGQEFIAVLLGGPNRYYRFSHEDVVGLVGRLQRVAAQGYRLAIIPSRRTPPHAVAKCRDAFGRDHFVWESSENPYRSALALASHVIVTGDSISMISEATATGRPVFVELLSTRRRASKFVRFHQSFLERGLIRPFVGRIEDWSYEPLYEADRIAKLLHDRLGLSFSLRMAE